MLLHSGILLLVFSCVHSNNFDGAIDNNAIFLDLSDLGIKTLKDYFFNSSVTTYINLANNYIALSDLSDAAFKGVQNLVYLNFSGNSPGFEKFDGEFPNLETLVLDGTTVSTPVDHGDFYSNYQIPKTQMSHNNFASMDFKQRLPNLKKLYLRSKNIGSTENLEDNWFPQLTHLYLNENHLQSSEFLEKLPKSLTHLFLNNNNFADIGFDENVGRYRWVYNFNTSTYTRVDEPFNIENLKNLLHLDLSNNWISNILENTFDNLTALITLRLDHNGFSQFPEIRGLVNLELLSLSHNQIHQLKQNNFESPKLKKLNLSNNSIERIDENAFINFPVLEELDLSENLLKSLPENWISMTNVKVLYLRANLFENFAQLSLDGAKNLTYLSVSGNPLKLTGMIKILNSLSENITIDIS